MYDDRIDVASRQGRSQSTTSADDPRVVPGLVGFVGDHAENLLHRCGNDDFPIDARHLHTLLPDARAPFRQTSDGCGKQTRALACTP